MNKRCYRCKRSKSMTSFNNVYVKGGLYTRRNRFCCDCVLQIETARDKYPAKFDPKREKELSLIPSPFKHFREAQIDNQLHFLWSDCV